MISPTPSERRCSSFAIVAVRVADDAEPVDDLVGHVVRMLGPLLGMDAVVVVGPALDVVAQLRRDLRGSVVAKDVGDVVADHGRVPAALRTGLCEIVGDVREDRAVNDDLGRIAAGLLGSFADELQRPLDEERIGDLEDDAVALAAGQAQRVRPVGGDVDREATLRPGDLHGTPSISTGLPRPSSRMTSIVRSRSASLAGLRFISRTELSPLPMPQITRLPPVACFRVANALASTVASRVRGFVTQVPSSSLSVFAAR